jgi:hypothetical protein
MMEDEKWTHFQLRSVLRGMNIRRESQAPEYRRLAAILEEIERIQKLVPKSSPLQILNMDGKKVYLEKVSFIKKDLEKVSLAELRQIVARGNIRKCSRKVSEDVICDEPTYTDFCYRHEHGCARCSVFAFYYCEEHYYGLCRLHYVYNGMRDCYQCNKRVIFCPQCAGCGLQ